MTSRAEREHWARLAAEATPGPWWQDKRNTIWREISRDNDYFVASFTCGIDREDEDNSQADSDFVVAARTALPLLLEDHARLVAMLYSASVCVRTDPNYDDLRDEIDALLAEVDGE